MQPINLLIQQMKEKEERDNAYAKKIQQYETIIKAEEESIKHFQISNTRLVDDLNIKLIENSKQEIKCEILKYQKTIWDSMLKDRMRALKEEEVKLEEVQQSICLDRVTFCENAREFLDKHSLLETSYGFLKPTFYPINTPVKKELDLEEYNMLCETVTNLERELEDVNLEVANIEDMKMLKHQLNVEPSSGEAFLRVQNSIKEKKDEVENIESQIRNVKSKIAEMELQLLNKKKTNSSVIGVKSMLHLQGHEPKDQLNPENEARNKRKSSENTTGADSKIVKFNDSVESICYSPQLKGILKARTFKAKSPSSTLKRNLTGSLLDEQIKDILFRNQR